MRRRVTEVFHPRPEITYLRVALHSGDEIPEPGQFYMLRDWNNDPLLSRPVAVHNYDEDKNELAFLIEEVGVGTKILSGIREGSRLTLYGPYGKGLKLGGKNLVLIGGGVGFAPLSYLCMDYRKRYPESTITSYVGFREDSYSVKKLKKYSSELKINCGGLITDDVKVNPGDTVVACGPKGMLETLLKSVPAENDLYIGVEARMACGLGACLGCVRTLPLVYTKVSGSESLLCTGEKQVKVCTEGPFFKREVLK